MSTNDSTDPTPRLSAVAVAVEQRLVDLGLDGDCIEATRADLATFLGVSVDAVKRALAALQRADRVLVGRNVGGHSCYARPGWPPDPPDPPSARPARPARAARPPDPPDLDPRAGTPACDQRSEPSKSISPSLDGNPAPAHEETARPPDPPDRPTSLPPGPAVIVAAVKAAERLGKPALDEALKTKLGSQAKRMHPAVSIEALEAAAVYLVEHDMTALDAAHRKSQSVAANRTSAGPIGFRPTDDEVAELWAAARESKAGRDAGSLSPHLEDELVEVWAFMASTWRHAPLPSLEDRALWHEQLRVLPTGCILWAIRAIARTGERYSPTWGHVWSVGFPKLHEERVKREMAEWRDAQEAE